MYLLRRHACVLAVLAAVFDNFVSAENHIVSVQTKKAVHEVGDHFLSLSVDPEIFTQHDFNSEDIGKLQAMAKAYSPAYVRLAGPWCQKYRFEPYGTNTDQFKINGETIEVVAHLLNETGLKLIMCLNPTLRNEDGSWNSTEARSLLQLVHMLDLKIAVEMGYERLKNEPNVSGSQMGLDLLALSDLLEEFPRFRKSAIVAPDLSNFSLEERHTFEDIVKASGSKIDAVTWHSNPDVIAEENIDCLTVGAMTSVAMSGLANKRRELYDEMTRLKIAHKPIWIGDGKAIKPQERFIDAMVWISRLGESAKIGADLVMQTPTLEAMLEPTPEFWVSALHRELVGRKVLNMRFANNESGRKAHLFSHCARQNSTSGGITVFGVNFAPETLVMELHGVADSDIKLYVLTAEKGLFQRDALLNERVPTILPADWLHPIKLSSNNGTTILIMPPESIAFWEIPNAKAEGCMSEVDDLKRGTREVYVAETLRKEEENYFRAEEDGKDSFSSEIEDSFGRENAPKVLWNGNDIPKMQYPESSEFSKDKSDGVADDLDDGANYYLVYHKIFITGPHKFDSSSFPGVRERRSTASLPEEPSCLEMKECTESQPHKVDSRSPQCPCYSAFPKAAVPNEDSKGGLFGKASSKMPELRAGGLFSKNQEKVEKCSTQPPSSSKNYPLFPQLSALKNAPTPAASVRKMPFVNSNEETRRTLAEKIAALKSQLSVLEEESHLTRKIYALTHPSPAPIRLIQTVPLRAAAFPQLKDRPEDGFPCLRSQKGIEPGSLLKSKLEALRKIRTPRTNLKTKPLTSLDNLPIVPSLTNKLIGAKQRMLEKRKAKAEKIAGKLLEAQKKKSAKENSKSLDKYKDAWPRVKGKSQHKVTGRKDLEKEEFSGVYEPNLKRDAEFFDAPLESQAQNRPKRGLNKLSDDIDFVLLDKSEINKVDYSWPQISKKMHAQHSESSKIPQKVDLQSTAPPCINCESDLSSKDQQAKDEFGLRNLQQLVHRMVFVPVLREANQFFCSLKKIFIPNSDCSFEENF